MVLMAATPTLFPLTVSAPVENDFYARTLIVSRPRDASGYQSLLWRESHQALLLADRRGATNLPPWAINTFPTVWASTDGSYQFAFATPGDGLTLRFTFNPGTPASKIYGELVSKPGLYAFVTVDRSSHRFLSVKFRHKS
jgi:hypothetical protein